MKLRFLGTRGLIEASSPRHARHSALLVEHRGRRMMIDCGFDWTGRLFDLRPEAILLTHAHGDHAHGLREGAPSPVWATEESGEHLPAFPVEKRTIEPRRPFEAAGVRVEAFSVQHSIRAPAVGFRIGAGARSKTYLQLSLSTQHFHSALIFCPFRNSIRQRLKFSGFSRLAM